MRKLGVRRALMILGILMMLGGAIALIECKAGARPQPDVSRVTATQAPACWRLAQEYGDDGLCVNGN